MPQPLNLLHHVILSIKPSKLNFFSVETLETADQKALARCRDVEAQASGLRPSAFHALVDVARLKYPKTPGPLSRSRGPSPDTPEQRWMNGLRKTMQPLQQSQDTVQQKKWNENTKKQKDTKHGIYINLKKTKNKNIRPQTKTKPIVTTAMAHGCFKSAPRQQLVSFRRPPQQLAAAPKGLRNRRPLASEV